MTFNSKTRIKITMRKIEELKVRHAPDVNYFYEFRAQLKEEAGLEETSRRRGAEPYYFFKIVNKQKYLFAKIKYGI